MAGRFSDIRRSAPGDPEVERIKDAMRTALELGRMREARHLTQVELARRLGVAQPSVSRLERRDDVFLSTLREYAAALGGELEVSVVFEDGDRVDLIPSREPVSSAAGAASAR